MIRSTTTTTTPRNNLEYVTLRRGSGAEELDGLLNEEGEELFEASPFVTPAPDAPLETLTLAPEDEAALPPAAERPRSLVAAAAAAASGGTRELE